jgi:competence protein
MCCWWRDYMWERWRCFCSGWRRNCACRKLADLFCACGAAGLCGGGGTARGGVAGSTDGGHRDLRAHFYRRLDLLSSAALAVLILLMVNPLFVTDTGFLLSFLAIGAIAGIALLLIQRNVQPILYALENWRDVTRDASHRAAMAQFRLDFRDAIFAVTSQMGSRVAKWVQDFGAKRARIGFRVGELFVLSFVL